ncbi:ubiquitin fusion degradation protein 1 homolog isoform X2 [Varroa jacobsoni]|uniref:ubiquitin fusion degradation protein 1 homolog isoform X2 n=1 Tax=Varroa jacobsoni TaxID=62625 RepID=UPI000BF93A21|nr:ubiquitin fusion degradation protein 1 homolog isoform X2 [Varroa jacobsoni]
MNKSLFDALTVIMPASALRKLTLFSATYPMMFKIRNVRLHRESHCGVLEFSAEEGRCLLPFWLMRLLLLYEGDLIEMVSVQLPIGTFARFQPQSVDFLDISDPRAVLERQLRNFACLSAGDVIAIEYNNHEYEVCVLETKPAEAISIVDCDLQVEFAAPVGYKEPPKKQGTSVEVDGYQDDFKQPNVVIKDKTFKAFSGQGKRIDGKEAKSKLNLTTSRLSDLAMDDTTTKTITKSVTEAQMANANSPEAQNTQQPQQHQAKVSIRTRGVPDYTWRLGVIKMIRIRERPKKDSTPKTDDKKRKGSSEDQSKSSMFTGTGHTLKPK